MRSISSRPIGMRQTFQKLSGFFTFLKVMPKRTRASTATTASTAFSTIVCISTVKGSVCVTLEVLPPDPYDDPWNNQPGPAIARKAKERSLMRLMWSVARKRSVATVAYDSVPYLLVDAARIRPYTQRLMWMTEATLTSVWAFALCPRLAVRCLVQHNVLDLLSRDIELLSLTTGESIRHSFEVKRRKKA